MSFCRYLLFMAIAVSVCSVVTTAQEQSHNAYYRDAEDQIVSHTSLASLTQQISEMEARLASFENSSFDGCDSASACNGCDAGCGCGDCCWDWWTSPNCGIVGSAEVVWLRPQYSSPATEVGTTYHHGSRFTLGYLNNCGREWRVRYFELHGDTLVRSPSVDNFVLDMNYWDVEYAARFALGCNWAGEISLGARYASVDDNRLSRVRFEDTIGPVIGLHLKSDVLFWDIHGFGNLRYSHQFGTGSDESSERQNLASFSITELQLGLEWSRTVNLGTVFVRGFFEAQKWDGDFDSSDEDIGLIGYGVGLGLTR